jgi:alanine racemase
MNPEIQNPFLRLYVDLEKVVYNYKAIQDYTQVEVSAVVKANGYGIGAAPIAKALEEEGCRSFFVATLPEAIALRKSLPKTSAIHIFNGISEETISAVKDLSLTPVVASLSQLDLCAAHFSDGFVLHFNTGMNRLSLNESDLEKVLKIVKPNQVSHVMSHLACADDPQDPKNRHQLKMFQEIISHFSSSTYSLAASEGIGLGQPYFFDRVRIGMSLYGTLGTPLGMTQKLQFAFKSQAAILQVHTIHKGESVGYGASYIAPSTRRIATIGIGFADGLPRGASNNGVVYLERHRAPIVGRVSMDLAVIDISEIPESVAAVGKWVDIVYDESSFARLAKDSGSAVYELITRLGQRYDRIYMR